MKTRRVDDEDFARRLSREIDEAVEATKNIDDAEMQDMINVYEKRMLDMDAEKERSIRKIELEKGNYRASEPLP